MTNYRPEFEGGIYDKEIYAGDFDEHVKIIQSNCFGRNIIEECRSLARLAMTVAFEAELQAASGPNPGSTSKPPKLSFDGEGNPLIDEDPVGWWDNHEHLDHCELFRDAMLLVRHASTLKGLLGSATLAVGWSLFEILLFETGKLTERIKIRLANLERTAKLGADLILRPQKMTKASMEARRVKSAKERKKEAEQLLRQSLAENPDRRDREIREEIALAMGIETTSLKRYLPADVVKKIRAEKKV